MQLLFTKRNVPLFFLIFISFFWTYYYTHDIWFNDYGKSKNELWLMIDIFITMPLVCFYFLGKNRKQALIKSLAFMGLLILLGSYIIPSEEKHLWKYLENMRFVGIIAAVLFELFIISTFVFAIKSAFNQNKDPDLVISDPLEKILGQSITTQLMQFDIRLWSFALFPSKINSDNYTGELHFYGDLKDGAQSFLQGFVFVILFEIPIMHVILHFIWSPLAANIITGLTLFSLAFFIAEYRALAKRPISLDKDYLIIRYGLSNPLLIKRDNILKVKHNTKAIYRNAKIKRYNLAGIPNIEITVKNNTFDKVYLGLNNPNEFIEEINKLY
jgi:hypothetical protein